MDMRYIRETYNVPAKRGGRIVYTGSELLGRALGTIVGSRGAYLRVRMDDGNPKSLVSLHPTWCIEYLKNPNEEIRVMGVQT